MADRHASSIATLKAFGLDDEMIQATSAAVIRLSVDQAFPLIELEMVITGKPVAPVDLKRFRLVEIEDGDTHDGQAVL